MAIRIENSLEQRIRIDKVLRHVQVSIGIQANLKLQAVRLKNSIIILIFLQICKIDTLGHIRKRHERYSESDDGGGI